MPRRTRRPGLKLLLALLLAVAQAMALAHAVGEASHPSQTVCNLCVTGHSLGASVTPSEIRWVAQYQPPARGVAPPAPTVPYKGHTPSQRAPPVSR